MIGSSGHPRRRGLCPLRLSARRGGTAHHRARRPAGRGRSPDRAREGDCGKEQRPHPQGLDQRGPSVSPSGPDASPPSLPWAASRLTTSAWTAPFRGRRYAGAARHGRAFAEARPARRQCLPRGRRQSPPPHPLRCNEDNQFDRAEAFGADILRLCVKVGGRAHRRAWRGDRKARPDARDFSRMTLHSSSG